MFGSARGFSLIELTVVLVLVSLIGGLVLPGLAGAYQSMSIREEQEQMLLRLGALGYLAFSMGKAIAVDSPDDVDRYLAPPDGWNIEIIEPIAVSQSGVCLGGELILTRDDYTRSIQITPPNCWDSE